MFQGHILWKEFDVCFMRNQLNIKKYIGLDSPDQGVGTEIIHKLF